MDKEKDDRTNKEMDAIIKWSIAEEDRIISELKQEGKWKPMLDGVVPELENHRKKYRKKMNELMQKYNLK